MRWGYVGALMAFGAMGVMLGAQSRKEDRKFTQATDVCSLQSEEVTESSGLAPSHTFPGMFYTHNDSGDKARVFRFDLKGKVNAEQRFDVKVKDCEAMATAKLGSRHWVYLADIGDNNSKKEFIQVHRAEERRTGDFESIETFRLTYDDGPHNAEAFFVEPKTGNFWIITKVNSGPSSVYRLNAPTRAGSFKLQKVGELSLPEPGMFGGQVTDASVTADGQHVAVRTYLGCYEFAVARFEQWFRSQPVKIQAPKMNQGEAVCYDLLGSSLYFTSEGRPCAVAKCVVSKQ